MEAQAAVSSAYIRLCASQQLRQCACACGARACVARREQADLSPGVCWVRGPGRWTSFAGAQPCPAQRAPSIARTNRDTDQRSVQLRRPPAGGGSRAAAARRCGRHPLQRCDGDDRGTGATAAAARCSDGCGTGRRRGHRSTGGSGARARCWGRGSRRSERRRRGSSGASGSRSSGRASGRGRALGKGQCHPGESLRDCTCTRARVFSTASAWAGVCVSRLSHSTVPQLKATIIDACWVHRADQ